MTTPCFPGWRPDGWQIEKEIARLDFKIFTNYEIVKNSISFKKLIIILKLQQQSSELCLSVIDSESLTPTLQQNCIMKHILLLACFITAPAIAQKNIRPITNPVWHGPAAAETSVHPIFMHQNLPKKLSTELGDVPVDGDFQLYALQFEINFAPNWSLIAVKDGFVDFQPDETLAETDGLADLAAGLKYVFHQDAETIMSARLVYELPTGDDDVWQGNGDGILAPAVTGTRRIGPWQLGGTLGLMAGLDDEDSDMIYHAWHVSYEVNESLFPLVELNHFHTFDAGDGDNRFDKHVEGGVPSVAYFEGGDLVNLGASQADDDDQVTLGLGCRYKINEKVSVGAAYEFPLTDEEEGLMEDRITADIHIRF